MDRFDYYRNFAQKVQKLFDLRPGLIEKNLKLRQPMYSQTAAYGHMGRNNETVNYSFTNGSGDTTNVDVELFTWEKLDRVNDVAKEFGI